MTTYELTQQLEPFTWEIGLALVALPIVTYLVGALLRACAPAVGRGFLALALFVAIVPGMSMAVVVLYMILFAHANLLRDMNLVLHLLPILSMLGTLGAASMLVPFAQIPGFARIQGFMILVGVSFGALFLLQKTFIGIHIFGRFEHLLLLLGALLALWHFGNSRLFKRSYSGV